MPIPRRARSVVLAALLLGLPLLVLRANLADPSRLNVVDRAILRACAPLQAGVTAAAAAAHRAWRRYVYLVGVAAENEALRAERDRLRGQLVAAEADRRTLTTCEDLLDLRTRRRLRAVAVRVVARQTAPLARALRLRVDAGGHALRPGQPVIAAAGLVGRIARVAGPYADVQLAVDPRSAVPVLVDRSKARGILRGVAGEEGFRARIDYVPRSASVRVGDLVVTSGAGGVYPKGIPVGRVSRAPASGAGLHREVHVTPVVDFGALDLVLVLTAEREDGAATGGGR